MPSLRVDVSVSTVVSAIDLLLDVLLVIVDAWRAGPR